MTARWQDSPAARHGDQVAALQRLAAAAPARGPAGAGLRWPPPGLAPQASEPAGQEIANGHGRPPAAAPAPPWRPTAAQAPAPQPPAPAPAPVVPPSWSPGAPRQPVAAPQAPAPAPPAPLRAMPPGPEPGVPAPRPRRREARAARRREARERFDPGLAAEGIVGHLVVTPER